MTKQKEKNKKIGKNQNTFQKVSGVIKQKPHVINFNHSIP